jgi:hypothetical protein
LTRDHGLVVFQKCYDSRGFASLALVLVLVLDLFFELFGLPTCIPSDPLYHLGMCITTTSASPSRNPCLACDFTGSYRDWTHLLGDLAHDRDAYASLCDEHREAVDEEVREQRAMWDWSPGGLGWAEDIAPNEFPHPEFDDAEAPNQFPDHPDGDWEGDDTGD